MNPKSFQTLAARRKATVRSVLRKEIADFLTILTTAGRTNWPDVPAQELTEAMADALVDMGRKRGVGVSLLQTLVFDLQDRVNAELQPTKPKTS